MKYPDEFSRMILARKVLKEDLPAHPFRMVTSALKSVRAAAKI